MLIYIAGTPRSGSTILQQLLALPADVVAAGELARGGRICARCGPSARCPIWHDLPTPRPLSRRPPDPTQIRAYLAAADALRRRTGARVVIDGSKHVGLARRLADRADVRLILLTRDAAGLLDAWSRPAQRPLSPAGAVAYHFWTLAQLRDLPGLRIDFATLMAEPEQTLVKLGLWTGIDTDEAIRRIRADLPIEVPHVLMGNRLIRAGAWRFRPPPPVRISGLRHRVAWRLMRLTEQLCA